jgi:hypothetical protein
MVLRGDGGATTSEQAGSRQRRSDRFAPGGARSALSGLMLACAWIDRFWVDYRCDMFVRVPAFVYRLIAPRPHCRSTCRTGTSHAGRHGRYWKQLMEDGNAVAFGPVNDPAGSYGLGLLIADDLAEAQAFARRRPGRSWLRTGYEPRSHQCFAWSRRPAYSRSADPGSVRRLHACRCRGDGLAPAPAEGAGPQRALPQRARDGQIRTILTSPAESSASNSRCVCCSVDAQARCWSHYQIGTMGRSPRRSRGARRGERT